MTRKIDQLAETLGNLSQSAEDLKDELGTAPSEELEALRRGLEAASDLADDLADDDDSYTGDAV